MAASEALLIDKFNHKAHQGHEGALRAQGQSACRA
jgi:hypothetical protein